MKIKQLILTNLATPAEVDLPFSKEFYVLLLFIWIKCQYLDLEYGVGSIKVHELGKEAEWTSNGTVKSVTSHAK